MNMKNFHIEKVYNIIFGAIIDTRQLRQTRQTLDRQTLDTTNLRHEQHKIKQTLDITNASSVLCYVISYVYHVYDLSCLVFVCRRSVIILISKSEETQSYYFCGKANITINNFCQCKKFEILRLQILSGRQCD